MALAGWPSWGRVGRAREPETTKSRRPAEEPCPVRGARTRLPGRWQSGTAKLCAGPPERPGRRSWHRRSLARPQPEAG